MRAIFAHGLRETHWQAILTTRRRFTAILLKYPTEAYPMASVRNRSRTVHRLLLVLAYCIFYVGLGAGLTLGPHLGTLLWLVAALLLAYAIRWFLNNPANRSPRQNRAGGSPWQGDDEDRRH